MTKQVERDFMGFNTFHHIKAKPVRDWNRMHTYMNIIGIKGFKIAGQYLDALGPKGRADVKQMMADVANNGLHSVRQEVYKHV